MLVRPDQHIAWRGDRLLDAADLLDVVTGVAVAAAVRAPRIPAHAGSSPGFGGVADPDTTEAPDPQWVRGLRRAGLPRLDSNQKPFD